MEQKRQDTVHRSFQSPSGNFQQGNAAARDGALSLDQIIQNNSGHPAEISPKGDLVHYVTFPGETLSMVARWYTRERSNAGSLARINRLRNPDKLSLGDVIVVPSYMLKNPNRMIANAVRDLTQLAELERTIPSSN